MKVYLCGPITGLTHTEANGGWRDSAAVSLGEAGVQALNPMRTEMQWRSDDVMPATFDGDSSAVACDVYDIQHSDVILANFLGAKRVSVGSVSELGIAFASQKFIVSVLEEGSLHDHMFIRGMSSVVVPTLEDALRVIVSLL